MGEKKKSGFTESFIVGVIAFVFLIIGYQTALLVYNASVARIAANRDEPDTVFVYVSDALAEKSSVKMSVGSGSVRYERRNAEHSADAEQIRRNSVKSRVESFKFNPNTVSVEELCRLGFTPRQAESIANYRVKGGRFYRKEDFAESFVVSDSIYRRLEPYIDIPVVDLNAADSAAFDALPGIGGWYATRMIHHRKALRGYSYKEQLMDIWKFDKTKYDALSDLITVSPDRIVPYPLWTLPADSLCRHPYIADRETARAIVLFRRNNPPESWNVAALERAGILSSESAAKLSRCAIVSAVSVGDGVPVQ